MFGLRMFQCETNHSTEYKCLHLQNGLVICYSSSALSCIYFSVK